MNLEQIRAQYPEYDDLSDMELARALHGQFYSDMEFGDFARRIGVQANSPSPAIPEGNALGDFLATFGNAAAFGLPRKFNEGLDERLDFLESNAPASANLAANAAGVVGTGAGLFAAGRGLGTQAAARGPALIAGAGNLARNRFIQAAAGGSAGFGLLKKLLDN